MKDANSEPQKECQAGVELILWDLICLTHRNDLCFWGVDGEFTLASPVSMLRVC